MSMVRALRGDAQPIHDSFYWEFHEGGFEQPFDRAGGRRCGSAWASRSSHRTSTPTHARNAMPRPPNAAVIEHAESYLRTARTPSKLWPVGQ
jgi:hypothetical protein